MWKFLTLKWTVIDAVPCGHGAVVSELGKRELLDVISIAVSKEERPRVSSRGKVLW